DARIHGVAAHQEDDIVGQVCEEPVGIEVVDHAGLEFVGAQVVPVGRRVEDGGGVIVESQRGSGGVSEGMTQSLVEEHVVTRVADLQDFSGGREILCQQGCRI